MKCLNKCSFDKTPKWFSSPAQRKAYTASALYKEGKLSVADICEQLNIALPTLYRYIKQQNIPLRADKPVNEPVNLEAF
ncbi:MAG: helix-turn-helix domain-containing protein [Burkholderiales bacterium]